MPYPTINEYCKNCFICVQFCTQNVYTVIDNKIIINPNNCTGCQTCVLLCPDFAIKINT